MGLVGMGGWFLVVYDWVYPHCKRGCVDSTIFERFSNNLIEFSPFFCRFWEVFPVLDNSRKRFKEVSRGSEFWR